MSPSIVILLGAPGAGKGTQAARLAAERGIPHVSTGDLFRENLKGGTDLGRRAKVHMEAGKLVPDELVLDMLFERVGRSDCTRGYVLDGFPRTLAQAEAYARRPDQLRPRVIEFEVSEATILARAAGRLTCRQCGNVQHALHAPPRVAGKCDKCGGELLQRPDDAPAIVRERLRVYHDQTRPLVQYYREQGLLEHLDGERAPDQVWAALLALLPPKEAA